ncbi:CinA family protein [Alkalilimnicola ehrlichii MLHE-1]|uniref:CinA domain protein n=1 Tax=Alkalilimnicola ehrlichii (strain ATCC BAA-1101 / DSM 17681 / MLHE-1) TaxID=187272 RepID=Q0A8K4_ALKEH|nr:CinA family protein [Alkalilimnicola ehrlichii]ABI56833.1 CinA domain protein [Alkalilimnicola ehrlichii MLHE-1]
MLNDDAALAERAGRLAELLTRRQWRLAVAESCTGGWIGKVITDLAGSSDWFERGWIVYSNAAKVADLGVPEALLARHGAVSAPVVEALAAGARERSGANAALSVSGVAGPTGGTAEKPVGLVWFGWALPSGRVCCERRLFAGDREAVRREAVALALDGLRERLGGDAG